MRGLPVLGLSLPKTPSEEPAASVLALVPERVCGHIVPRGVLGVDRGHRRNRRRDPGMRRQVRAGATQSWQVVQAARV